MTLIQLKLLGETYSVLAGGIAASDVCPASTLGTRSSYTVGGNCEALNTLQVPAISVPSVTACCVLTVLPSSFLFVLFFSVLFAFSFSPLFLPYSYFIFIYLFFCIFLQLNKPNRSSCTLQAPHVLPAHISVNRKQEQAETRSHPRCCLPHLPTVYPFSNQIPPSHGCPNGTTFKLQCSGL
jgi:hypothetical protein